MRVRYNSNQTDTSFGTILLIAVMVLALFALVALIFWLLMTPEPRMLA